MRRSVLALLAATTCAGAGCATAKAADVRVALFEEKTKTTSVFRVETRSVSVTRQEGITGTKVQQSTKYKVRNRKLVVDGKPLADADDILFQGEVDRDEIVVVRCEYNSFFGPWKLLSAMAGHPVQVSKIVLLKIDEGVVMGEQVLAREEYSYDWRADLYR
jgi:hypothetical protein